jgi:hypothetical protein
MAGWPSGVMQNYKLLHIAVSPPPPPKKKVMYMCGLIAAECAII